MNEIDVKISVGMVDDSVRVKAVGQCDFQCTTNGETKAVAAYIGQVKDNTYVVWVCDGQSPEFKKADIVHVNEGDNILDYARDYASDVIYATWGGTC